METLTNNLIGTSIKKKELPMALPHANIDISLKGGAWQTELRRMDLYCKFEIEGKGAGTKYVITEVFDTPMEKVHGNIGKEPVNKGVVDTESMKYIMSQALIAYCKEVNGHLSKNEYLKYFGIRTDAFAKFVKYFSNKNYNALGTIDKFAYDTLVGHETSLSRTFNAAIDLIKSKHFPNHAISEELWVATFDSSSEKTIHCPLLEADFCEDENEIYELYQQAKAEAKEIVGSKYRSLLFNFKAQLENNEYNEIIEDDEQYEVLVNNSIEYIYVKYYVYSTKLNETNAYAEDYDYEDEMLEETYDLFDYEQNLKHEFYDHRIDTVLKNVEKKFATTKFEDGFYGVEGIKEFVEVFYQQLMNDEYEIKFSKLLETYMHISKRAKESYQNHLKNYVESQLPF